MSIENPLHFTDEPDQEGVPEEIHPDWAPEDYQAPEYDETEPLEGDTHDRGDEVQA